MLYELAPQMAWHPARLIKRGCVDMSMDTMHLKDPWYSLDLKALLLLLLFSFFHLEWLCFVIVLQQWQRTTFGWYCMTLNGLCVPMWLYTIIHSFIPYCRRYPLPWFLPNPVSNPSVGEVNRYLSFLPIPVPCPFVREINLYLGCLPTFVILPPTPL